MNKSPITIEELLKQRKISQVVFTPLVKAAPNVSITEVVALMQKKRSGYALIMDDGKVLGIFTETDLVRRVLAANQDLTQSVENVMTENPASLTPADSIGKAIDLMVTKSFYHVPLMAGDGSLSGVLSVRALIRFLAEFYPTEIYNLPPRADQFSDTPEGG